MTSQRHLDPDELKRWRDDHGLSQSGAAKHFSVSLRTYQGWEAGRRRYQAGIIREMMRRKPKRAKPEPAPPPRKQKTLFD